MIFGGTAISEDMFQMIPRGFNNIADDLADTGCLVGNRIIENKSTKSTIHFSECTSMVVHTMETLGQAGAWSRHGPERGIFQCGLQQ